jgi:hypothetical protein
VRLLNSSDPQSLAGLREALLSRHLSHKTKDAASSPSMRRLPTPALLLGAWKNLPAGPPEPQLSPGELRSLLAVEEACALGMQQIDTKVAQWRSRVNAGKLLGSFGARVTQFAAGVHQAYMARTALSLVVRERATRLKQLREAVRMPVSILHQQQMLILRAQSSAALKVKLENLAESSSGLTKKGMTTALQECINTFRIEANSLTVESFGVENEDSIQNVISSLEKLCQNFPKSSAAKVAAIRRLQREVAAPPPKPSRGVSMALSLVGLLRPPGGGNFQGFVNYATGVFGFPLDLMLGTINDGEDWEVRTFDMF